MTEGVPTAKVGTIVKEDPILRFSGAGKPFTKFSLQVKPYSKEGPTPEALYYEVTCFGTLAEHVAECMKKGYRVGVIGTGKLDEWTSQTTGKSGTTKVILADSVGPDLRFVTAVLQSATPAVTQPAAPVYATDEEPF